MSELLFFGKEEKKLNNLKEAIVWVSQYLNCKVTISNISYLLQYGRIKNMEVKEICDFLGNDSTYEELLNCFERVGIELRPEIDAYFLQFK